MKEVIINGERITSKEALYSHLNRLFCFPSYFGNNLDALWDVLTDEVEPTMIHFKNVFAMQEQLGNYGEKVIRLFQNLEDHTDNYTVYFYEFEIED